MKRAFVPTALHDELTEYANLVRVLRTTRTLDLTSHLLQFAAEGSDKDADTWTSWPLIDCPVPEWSLEDEIQQLGETVVRQMQDSEPEGDAVEELSPVATKHLVLHTTSVLVHILNLLANLRPSALGSMQNRLWKMNWEDVISLLAVTGVVDPAIVARAEKRLERIYGPSSTKAMQRLAPATAVKTRCTSLEAIAEDQLFATPVVARTYRNEGSQSFKSSEFVETDIETDLEAGD